MKFGSLNFSPVEGNENLIGEPTAKGIIRDNLNGVLVSAVDPSVSDTAAFCERYGAELINISVNCVIVEAKRGEKSWYAVLMIPGGIRADINGIVRRELDAKKVSFAPMEAAVSLSGMEFGGICPIGLPKEWPILVDSGAAALDYALIGSGVRSSKLIVPGSLLTSLPGAKVLSLDKPTI